MCSGQFYEKSATVRESNIELLLETVTHIATTETVTCIITIDRSEISVMITQLLHAQVPILASSSYFQVPILFNLKVMVTSCGVVGCAKNRSSAPKEGFFLLPSIVNTDETSKNCLDRGAIYGYQESIAKI